MIGVVPQSWGVEIAEFNRCHSPENGEFCSAPDSGGGGGQLTSESAPSFFKGDVGSFQAIQKTLHDTSYFGMLQPDDWREAGALFTADGEFLSEVGIMEGNHDAISFKPVVDFLGARRDTVATIHTHPSSSAFSLADLSLHRSLNERFGMRAPTMMVFGQDGSWYSLTQRQQIAVGVWVKMIDAYDHLREEATEAFQREITATLAPRLGIKVTSGPYAVRQAVAAMGLDGELEVLKRQGWQTHTDRLWRSLAKAFPDHFTYESSVGHRRPKHVATPVRRGAAA